MQGACRVPRWSGADLGREQALAAIAAADCGDLAFEERDEQQIGARVPPSAEPAVQRRVPPRLQDVCRPRQRSMWLRLRRRWRQGGVEERLGVRVHRQLGAAGQARPGAPLVTSQLLVRPAGQERPHERVHLPGAKGSYGPANNTLLIEFELRQARPKSACTATNRRLVMSLVLLLAASEGHVRLNFIDGLDQPIRNAGTATGNGRASVAGGLRMVKT
eukprot:scaffold103072_cov47-Phaeocystis_antarctica.AAC.3